MTTHTDKPVLLLMTHQTHQTLQARCGSDQGSSAYKDWIRGTIDAWLISVDHLSRYLSMPEHPSHWWPLSSPTRGRRFNIKLDEQVYARLEVLSQMAGNLKFSDMCWTAIVWGMRREGWLTNQSDESHQLVINLDAGEYEAFEALGSHTDSHTQLFNEAMYAWLSERHLHREGTFLGYAARRRGPSNSKFRLRVDPKLHALVCQYANLDEVHPAAAFYTILRRCLLIPTPCPCERPHPTVASCPRDPRSPAGSLG